MLKNLISKGLISFGWAVSLGSAATDPLSEPLVQKSDLVFLGSFALPTAQVGTSRFGYGGEAITAYHDSSGRATLFMCGNVQMTGHVAQVEIPATFSMSHVYSELPVAKQLQPFASVVDGSVSSKLGITSTDGAHVYGMLAYKNRLVVSAGEYYGCTQSNTHGYSKLALNDSTDFKGFYKVVGAANARGLAGPMTHVPPEWQSLLGGTVLSGNFGIPLVSCTSAGPSITAFEPDSLGTNPTNGNTLLFYPMGATFNHTLCDGAPCLTKDPGGTQNELYNYTTQFGGLAFAAGSRSVLFFGRQGTGPYCYGTPAGCGGDPAEPDAKGPHAFPYRYQIWAYDAKDLVLVKNGTLKTYDPKPYAVWAMPEIEAWRNPGTAKITGAGFDPETQRWYITADYGEKPRVDVYQIKPATVGIKSGMQQQNQIHLKLTALANPGNKSITFAIPGISFGGGSTLSSRYRIFNTRGTLVGELSSKATDAKATWDTTAQPAGVYFVKAEGGGLSLVTTVALDKDL